MNNFGGQSEEKLDPREPFSPEYDWPTTYQEEAEYTDDTDYYWDGSEGEDGG